LHECLILLAIFSLPASYLDSSHEMTTIIARVIVLLSVRGVFDFWLAFYPAGQKFMEPSVRHDLSHLGVDFDERDGAEFPPGMLQRGFSQTALWGKALCTSCAFVVPPIQ